MTKYVMLLVLLFSALSEASLMIHPIRVQFNETDRFQTVTLMNQTQITNSYRVEFLDQNTSVSATGVADNSKLANSMLRVSPRQVTLKPGERQTVKLSIRRPANMSNGEYRTQLKFQAIPAPSMMLPEEKDKTGVSFKFRASFIIPVVVLKGAPDINVSLDDALIIYNQTTPSDSKVSVSILNSGTYSGHGDVKAYWKPAGGKENLLAISAGYNSWPGTGKKSIQLGWFGSQFALSDGVLRIAYEGARDYQGKIFAERQFNITKGQISIMR